MKKVININFHGRVVPIEESSFEILKLYTDSLRTYFANEEGKDEIINDIESRIGELFQEYLKKGATCITDSDVNEIIKNMGRPEDLAAAEDEGGNTQQKFENKGGSQWQNFSYAHSHKRLYRDQNNKVLGGVCSGIAAYFNIEPIIVRLAFIFTGIGFVAYLILWAFLPSSDSVHNGLRKRLYRNPDDKIIAGVCSGIANYFNFNVWIPRILFLIPFISIFFRWGHFGPLNIPHFISFSFSPGTILIYIILWLVIPEAITTSEKLEMKGERIDLNSIKNSVVEEMKGVKGRVEKLGSQAKEFAKQQTATMGPEVAYAARRTRRSIGDFIIIVFKIFLYFIAGIFGLMAFGFAIAATGIFPFKDYLLTGQKENALAWGTLIFLIYVPVIGIITFILRRIARAKSNRSAMRYSFLVLWLVGVFCFISLIVSVGRNFKSMNSAPTEQVKLSNPNVNHLDIVGIGNRFRSFRIQPFSPFTDDTVFINNVTIRLIKSTSDIFQVSLNRFCHGSSRYNADILARKIQFNVVQSDSILYIDKGIGFTEHDKFRNQHVVITIAIPVGKSIRIDNNVAWSDYEHFDFPWSGSEDEYDWGTKQFNWSGHHGEDLIMRENGLYTFDGEQVDITTNNYRSRRHGYGHPEDSQIPESDPQSGKYRNNPQERINDSARLLKDQQIRILKDSLEKIKEKINNNIQRLQNGEHQEAYLRKEEHTDFIIVI